MNTHRDPWSIATPTGNREDIFERGTVTRAQLNMSDPEPQWSRELDEALHEVRSAPGYVCVYQREGKSCPFHNHLPDGTELHWED